MSPLALKKKEKPTHVPIESTLAKLQQTKIEKALLTITGDFNKLKKSGNQLSAAKRKRKIKKFASSVYTVKKGASARRKKRILTSGGKARPRREKIVKGFVVPEGKRRAASGLPKGRGFFNAPSQTAPKVEQKFNKFQRRIPLPPSGSGLPTPLPLPGAQVDAGQLKHARAGHKENQKQVFQKQAGGRKNPRSTAKLRDVSFRKAFTSVSTIYIQSTHNNTLYTLTDSKGKTRNWISAGRCGFKNTRKATSYASQAAAQRVALLAKECNIKRCVLKIKGMGPGKLSGVHTLHQSGLRITRISECTPLPHNGCRAQKSRRI